jgi:putative ABC transport system ATP-binding protein
MTEPVIEATDVVKYLQGRGARRCRARCQSFAHRRGAGAALGPSGSGKTTLLSMLGCMLTPTSGTVRMLGRSTAGLAPERLADLRRRHVGFIFQSYHLFPTLTAVENVRPALR